MSKEIMRRCIACGEVKKRNELIKITRHFQSGEIEVQPDSKFFGKSLYVCSTKNCVSLAFKKNKIFKLLKIKPNETLIEKINTVLEG